MTNYAAALAAQFHLKEQQTAKLIELIDAGNTIPFIARYRKEEHGSLDDQTIRTVYERLQYLRNLDTRKAEVRELIEGTGNLTPEIEKSLTNAATLAEITEMPCIVRNLTDDERARLRAACKENSGAGKGC